MSTNDKDKKAAEAEERANLQAALAPFARIAPQGELRAARCDLPAEYTGSYRVARCRQRTEVRGEDIVLAARCVADPAAALDDCRKALRAFGRLPVDVAIEDPLAVVFVFPAAEGAPVAVTNPMIERARTLCGM